MDSVIGYSRSICGRVCLALADHVLTNGAAMMIDRALFAQECVRQGMFFGVNPHYLLAVAQFRSKISDDSADGQIGPFQLRQSQWNANSESDEFDLHFTPEQIGSSSRQCAVFGFMAHRAFDTFVSIKGRNPSAKELYLQQWPDTPLKNFDAELQEALDVTSPLLGPAAAEVLDDPQSAPPEIAVVDQKTDRQIPPVDPDAIPAGAGEAPEWYRLALGELGTREEGDNSGAAIARYRKLAQCGQDHDPWCAIFTNAMFALCKSPAIPGTKSASSQSFRTDPKFEKLDGPALGAVVVFWRKSPRSGLGHVGFYRGETAESVYVLGGNEDDMVQIQPLSKIQLRGYWWPTAVVKPKIEKIVVPPGTPKHQTKVT
jgi:uncharacterized protein (TIGR02594 family)